MSNRDSSKHRRASSAFSEKSAWPRPAPLPPSGLHQATSAPRDDREQHRSRSKYDHRRPPPPRKCCGMPLWLFFVLLIAALILIVLAVVLPVALIVIPNDKKTADPSCASKRPCQNSGISLPDAAGTCRCICPSGFTGVDCSTPNSIGSCGTVAVPGLPNAAIGSQLPPLINAASPQYQIPLNATSILTALSLTDINCDVQNTLVSFTRSVSGRSAAAAADEPPAPSITISPHRGSQHQHPARQDSPSSLVFATSATSSPSSQPTATNAPQASQYSDQNHMTFAKTAILYALQVSQQLNVATTAGNRLQPWFNGLGSQAGDPHSVDMGNGFSLDLVGLKVNGPDGSVGSNVAGNP